MSTVKRKHAGVEHRDATQASDKKQAADEAVISIVRGPRIGPHDGMAATNMDKEYEAFQRVIQLEAENAENKADELELQALLEMAETEERITLAWQKRVQDLKSLASETMHATAPSSMSAMAGLDGLEKENTSSSSEEEGEKDDDDGDDISAVESFFLGPSAFPGK